MFDDASPDEPPACAECAAAELWAERSFRRLERLAELGMEIAEGLAEAARAPAEASTEGRAEARGDLAMRFARVARAVRQTEALQARLRGDVAAGLQKLADARKARIDARRIKALGERKALVRRVMRQAIVAGGRDLQRPHLNQELDEQLEMLADEPEEFAEGPISALVAQLCLALGLDPDWRIWVEQPWAVEEITHLPEGSVFIDFLDEIGRRKSQAADGEPGLDPPDDDPDPDSDDGLDDPDDPEAHPSP